MATPKDAYALASYFEKAWTEKYGVKPVINRYSSRWGFDSILAGMAADDIKELIDYYLTTHSTNRHKLDTFFYTYDKLAERASEQAKDVDEQARIREETRIRTEKWRARVGNNRGKIT